MRTIFPIILISVTALSLLSCNSNRETERLYDKIDSLSDYMYKPGFGEFMSNIQAHHGKLWLAGINQNWKLAEFELNEIIENEKGIKHYCTDRPEVKNLPMIKPAIDSVKKSIERKSDGEFKNSYIYLTKMCNECHTASKYEFIKIRVPETNQFSNQEFK